MGEYESLNFLIGVEPEDLSLFHALYRTSPKGRKDFVNLMFSEEDDDGVIEGELDDFYTNRVAEIFNVYLKCLGLSLDFVEDNDILSYLSNDTMSPHSIGGEYYLCTNYQAYILERIKDIRDEILEENPIIETDKLEKEILNRIEKYKYMTGDFKDAKKIFKMADRLLMKDKDIIEYEKSLSDNNLIVTDDDEDDDEEEGKITD